MSRKSSKSTPVVISGMLYTEDEYTGLRVSSPEWFGWLARGQTFYVEEGRFTVRAEKRHGGLSWYAFKKIDGKLFKKYVGRTAALSLDKLRSVPNWGNATRRCNTPI